MAKWLARRGASVRVADTRTAPPRLAELKRSLPSVPANCGPFRDETFADIDLVAVSPGVPLAEPTVRRVLDSGTEVVGDVELFAQALAERHPRIIAVTGTNGKSTVTSLAGAMARAAGVDCEVAGNIGPAVLDALMRREDAERNAGLWVLELSSFQLETTTSLAADAAAVLNITEDHLDRYRGIDDYARAKARVFSGDGIQVLNRDDPRSLAMALPGRKTSTFGLDAPRRAEDWGLLERGGEPWLAQGAGLPHRVELVGEADGVRWYDDSKGTNVGSTVAALAGLAQGDTKLVLIAGGDGKGQDFSPLRSAVKRSVRGLVLIGRDAPLIEAAVAGAGVPIRRAASMDQAVALAAQAARPGDAVLLSPACASFDMFRDYRHRGEVFRLAVERVIDAPKH
ncbi:MAG: UDP-N-acetylmuramoyl-L-alanine--D-glutamate ligase [Betaproteobacteria bacterium]|nr:MAG: UDP-N-acetylmuramoyl-L-alanine--D-glutamate ligase [Betaproteobacteria bacterium]